MLGWICFYGFILLLSYLLTGALRRYALTTKLLDIPNHRSSHVVPTPRGGGLSFVVCFMLVVIALTTLKLITLSMCLVLVGGGFCIALLGFLDDNASLPAKWRLLGHFTICGISLYLMGGMPAITFLYWVLPSGLVANTLAVFYLVWLLNLYNFMDGIDGIAGVEAVTVCISTSLLYFLQVSTIATLLPISLAFAVGGFLLWNFPPARIFMGDAGSGFLGFILGILSIYAAGMNEALFWSWLILLGVFISDATVTLFVRCFSGEPIFDAHCSHAYQHASRYYGKHRVVTLGVLIINICWLLPFALLVANHVINGLIGLVFSYLPLIIIALKFNAGKNK